VLSTGRLSGQYQCIAAGFNMFAPDLNNLVVFGPPSSASPDLTGSMDSKLNYAGFSIISGVSGSVK
jgi:hypothetical protein